MRYRRLTTRYLRLVASDGLLGAIDLLRLTLPAPIVAAADWRPAADVSEAAEAIQVTVELAGIDEDEIDILLFDDALVVQGERSVDSGLPGGRFHAAEIRQGSFRLGVRLSAAVDPDRVEATYDRGLLRIRLPKAPPTEVPVIPSDPPAEA